HHHVARIAGILAGFGQPHRHRLHHRIDRHHQRDAQNCKQRGPPSDQHISQIVVERERHVNPASSILSPRSSAPRTTPAQGWPRSPTPPPPARQFPESWV